MPIRFNQLYFAFKDTVSYLTENGYIKLTCKNLKKLENYVALELNFEYACNNKMGGGLMLLERLYYFISMIGSIIIYLTRRILND